MEGRTVSWSRTRSWSRSKPLYKAIFKNFLKNKNPSQAFLRIDSLTKPEPEQAMAMAIISGFLIIWLIIWETWRGPRLLSFFFEVFWVVELLSWILIQLYLFLRNPGIKGLVYSFTIFSNFFSQFFTCSVAIHNRHLKYSSQDRFAKDKVYIVFMHVTKKILQD